MAARNIVGVVDFEVETGDVYEAECNQNGTSNMSAPLARESLVSKVTSCRWRLGLMSFCSFLLLFAFRHCFSFAIVCMEREIIVFDNDTGSTNRTNGSFVTKIENPYLPTELRGVVLSCYFYGYLLTPLISGYLAAKFGPKILIGLSMSVSVVVMVVIPIGFRVNVYIVIGLRFIMGFVSGTVVPATQVLWSNWAPISERTQLTAMSNSGINIASISSTIFSGLLCETGVDEGWPLIFYVFAGVGALWLIFWALLAYDSPDLHPRCSEAEKQRIYHGKTSIKPAIKALPWKQILRNPPFWALVTNHVAYSWITNTIQTFTPMYMSDVLKFDITENGLLSALPSLGRFFAGIFFSYLADLLITSSPLSITANRKLFQSFGTIIPGVFLIGMSYLGSEQNVLAVGLLTLAMTFQAFTMASFRVNHLDIAPRYAGQLMGFTLTCGCCSAIMAPLVSSAITVDRTREEWQVVFFITAGIVIVTDILYVLFASGVEQDWAKEHIYPRSRHNLGTSDIPNRNAISAISRTMPCGGLAHHGNNNQNSETPSTRVNNAFDAE